MYIEVVLSLDVMRRKFAKVYFVKAVRSEVWNVSNAKGRMYTHYLVWVVDLVEAKCERNKREDTDDCDASLVRLEQLLYLTAASLLAVC